jgi:hypothetical protein
MQGRRAFPREATDSSRFETRHIERDAGVTSNSVAFPATSMSAAAIASLSPRTTRLSLGEATTFGQPWRGPPGGKNLAHAHELLTNRDVSVDEVAATLGVHRSALYRVLARKEKAMPQSA